MSAAEPIDPDVARVVMSGVDDMIAWAQGLGPRNIRPEDTLASMLAGQPIPRRVIRQLAAADAYERDRQAMLAHFTQVKALLVEQLEQEAAHG